ncbi:MAG TPA: hypothetical protein VGE89_08280 [Bryobacteraceae bacterium]|jgi:hypothetical protein
MLTLLKQARSALALLNPEEVRSRSSRLVTIGLVASSDHAYARLEEFLVTGGGPREFVFRAGIEGAPERVDLVICEAGIEPPPGAFALDPVEAGDTLAAVARHRDDIALALARRHPVFRRAVVDRAIQAVACENALFAIATALPDVVPNLIELPWVLGEWASDTAFLTANQLRLAFFIAAASGKPVGFGQQKLEILSIGASAFGWRALARELAGKIPFGGGLIPKGAIAYAGTYLVGKALERLHAGDGPLGRRQRKEIYRQGIEQGKAVASSVLR